MQGAMAGLEGQALDMKTAVGGAGAALAAAAAGGIVAATKSAYDFEAAMADVEKVTSAETAKELEGRFMDLAETIPIPREELVKLGEQAGKFGAEGPEEIESFVTAVGKIQTATDLAAEEAGTRFAKIAGAVGIPLTEIDKLGNATNALADSMKTDAGEITDTANRTANILSQQLGLGEDAVLALSASMNEVSPSSQKAAGALTRVAEAMLDPKKVGDISAALGMTSDEFRTMRDENPQKLMRKIAKRMAEGGDAATELRTAVGKRAARGFSKLGSQVGRTDEAMGTVNEQFKNGTSLANEMSIRTNTAAGQWQLFKNKVQNAATTTGQKFLPILKNVLGGLNSTIDALGKANEATDGWLGAIGLVGGLLGGVVMAVGAFGGVIASSATALAAGTGAVSALGTALAVLTGPIGLAIAAAVALYAAYESNFLGLKDVVDGVIGSVAQTIDRNVGPIMEKLGRIASMILEWLNPAIETLAPVVDYVFGSMAKIISAAMQVIGGVVSTYFDYVFTVINATLSLILGDTDEAMRLMEGLFDRTLAKVLSWFQNWPLAQAIGETMHNALKTFEKTVNQLPGVQLDVTSKMENIVRNSNVPKEHERNQRKAQTHVKRGGRNMARQTQSSMADQESAVRGSSLPSDFQSQYAQGQTLQGQQLNGMQTQHGQALGAMETDTRNWSMPEAGTQKYKQWKQQSTAEQGAIVREHGASLGAISEDTRNWSMPQETQSSYKQANKFSEEELGNLSSEHASTLDGIVKDTGNWSVDSEVDSKYGTAYSNAQTGMGNWSTEHSEGLSGMETDTGNWGMPGKMENRLSAAFTKLANAMENMTMRLSQALGSMQSTTQSWGLPGAMETPMTNTTGVVRREGGQMVDHMGNSLSSIESDASGIESAATSARNTAVSAASEAARALSRARRNAGRASSVARSASRTANRGGRDEGLTQMHTGGYVGATGAALLEAGEYVLSESDVKRGAKPPSDGSGGGGDTNVYDFTFEGDVVGDEASLRELFIEVIERKDDQKSRRAKRKAPSQF